MFHETFPSPPPPSTSPSIMLNEGSWRVPTVRPHFLAMHGLLDPPLKKRWLTSVGLI